MMLRQRSRSERSFGVWLLVSICRFIFPTKSLVELILDDAAICAVLLLVTIVTSVRAEQMMWREINKDFI
jgi:hypothetical protein